MRNNNYKYAIGDDLECDESLHKMCPTVVVR